MVYYWGAAVAVPLVYVEVQVLPRQTKENHNIIGASAEEEEEEPRFTAAFVKQQWLTTTVRSCLLLRNTNTNTSSSSASDEPSSSSPLYIHWDDDDDDDVSTETEPHPFSSGILSSTPDFSIVDSSFSSPDSKEEVPILWLQQDNPLITEPWPCFCRGYAVRNNKTGSDATNVTTTTTTTQKGTQVAVVTDATMVRILPSYSSNYYYNHLTGELPESPLSEELQDEVLHNHSKQTIQELTLRMRLLLSEPPILVGTTRDALELHRQNQRRHAAIQTALKLRHLETTTTSASILPEDKFKHDSSNNDNNKSDSFFLLRHAGALLVHSPEHGAGKTLLVETLARRHLQCSLVFVVRGAPLLAKYGIYADTALETVVHQAALAAAVGGGGVGVRKNKKNQLRQRRVCMILDGLEAFLPTAVAGDAAAPVLQGMASYLKSLMESIQRRREIPFPSNNNPLYNLNGTNGWAVPVQFCLAAIATCPDSDNAATAADFMQSSSFSVLNSIPAGRYRLPALTAETRYRAFAYALQKAAPITQLRKDDDDQDDDVRKKLFSLSAAAVWARGTAFGAVARRVRDNARTTLDGKTNATVEDFAAALSSVAESHNNSSLIGSQVEFLNHQQHQHHAMREDDHDNVHFKSVGGNQEAKMALEDALALDPGRRKLLRSFGLAPPTGIILFGPPGCGKTLLARSVAQLLQHQRSSSPSMSSNIGGAFISLRSTDVARAEVGAGEKMVASAFATARMNSPSVVFIDEFQALFTERSSGGSSRLTTTLLQCMDDIKQWSDVEYRERSLREEELEENDDVTVHRQETRVVVLAATNTPWMVDKAFLRPGRFDRAVHVGLPDREERTSILKLLVGRMRVNLPSLGETQSMCELLALDTDGFSGADLAALCRAAAVRCLLENMDSVEEKHFVAAMKDDVRPSTSQQLVERIEQWRL